MSGGDRGDRESPGRSDSSPPDFRALFRRDVVRALRFKVGANAHYLHDVVFLSSYLHDARFTAAAVARRGKRLTIDFDRDCWELGYTDHAASRELHTAKSRLTIAPVADVRWEIDDPASLNRELWVESIYLGPDHWEIPDASEVVISAPYGGWRLVISVDADRGDITLRDLEKPSLFSARKA